MYVYCMKPDAQLFKGSLTTIILKLLSENERMYGYEITKKVKELTNGSLQLTEGALYPSLHKLETEGHVKAIIQSIGNRQRKYYKLTPKGKTQVKNKLSEYANFLFQMQLLLNLKPAL